MQVSCRQGLSILAAGSCTKGGRQRAIERLTSARDSGGTGLTKRESKADRQGAGSAYRLADCARCREIGELHEKDFQWRKSTEALKKAVSVLFVLSLSLSVLSPSVCSLPHCALSPIGSQQTI